MEKIEGAFGLKLGEVFDIHSSVSASPDGIYHQFSPPTSFFSPFQSHLVSITPKTRVICAILGLGRLKSYLQAAEEKKAIMNILMEQYGEVSKTKNTFRIGQGNREITVGTSGSGGIYINYNDDELIQLAEEEEVTSGNISYV